MVFLYFFSVAYFFKYTQYLSIDSSKKKKKTICHYYFYAFIYFKTSIRTNII